jgi:copper chaperone CopZ
MTSIELVIAGMTCPMCTGRVTQALRAVTGVQTVEVDWKTGIAHVKGGAAMEPLSSDLLILALEEAGYPAQILHPGAPQLPTTAVKSGCCCKR